MEESELMYRMTEYIFNVIGVNLNTSAFLTTIELLGNDEQVKKWRKMVLDGKIFGGYGQTELGHGSNVQGLETEAHYDEKKQIFRVSSPQITSAKYWPGNLGLNSTHNVIQAKTYVKGKSIGMQTFIF
jgi:alkylation response protein AidB-like acyl-CoA dehydrogenase